MIKPKGFPKKARLTKRVEFLKIKNGAVTTQVGILAVFNRKANTLEYCRLGITVSRKFGKAVIRNRFKRAVREAFRHFNWRGASFDIHIRPRAKAVEAKSREIMAEVSETLDSMVYGKSTNRNSQSESAKSGSSD